MSVHYDGNILPSSSFINSLSTFQGCQQTFSPYDVNNTNADEEGGAHVYGPSASLFQQVAMGSSHYPYNLPTYPPQPSTFMIGDQTSERNYYPFRPIGGQAWSDHRQDNSGFYPRDMYPSIPGSPWINSFANPLALRSRQPKPKRPRMSLQKRLLVNSRERERMRVLNKAFESLRDALPCYIADGHMAKITTLRLAINYIKALTDLLNEQRVMVGKSGGGVICCKERTHEDIFSTIFKDSKVEGVKPVLKDLNERLAITKTGQQQQDMLEAFPSVIQYY